jgi:ubiquinone/menaquinone biosynthesis C-methylase UbiE
MQYLEPVAKDSHGWRALELGGGGGVLAGLLAEQFGSVVCTDLFNPSLAHQGRLSTLLEEKFERNGGSFPLAKVEFLAADAQRLPFRAGWFDICYSQNTFEHIPDPEMALREAVRVARPGGFVYLQFDPVWTADSGSHFLDHIGQPWIHLIEGDAEILERMRAAGASEKEMEAFRTEMNRQPISYYREMFPRVIRQCGLEVVLHHQWSGTIDPSWTEHPNLARAAAATGLRSEDLLVRGLRYLLRTPTTT